MFNDCSYVSFMELSLNNQSFIIEINNFLANILEQILIVDYSLKSWFSQVANDKAKWFLLNLFIELHLHSGTFQQTEVSKV